MTEISTCSCSCIFIYANPFTLTFLYLSVYLSLFQILQYSILPFCRGSSSYTHSTCPISSLTCSLQVTKSFRVLHFTITTQQLLPYSLLNIPNLSIIFIPFPQTSPLQISKLQIHIIINSPREMLLTETGNQKSSYFSDTNTQCHVPPLLFPCIMK